MLDVVLTIFEFLFGFEILVHVFDPVAQELLIHRTKLQTYHRHYEKTLTFELLHILPVDGLPGGFHPVLPRHISDLDLFGMARFNEVLGFSQHLMKHYREPHPKNLDIRIDFKYPNHPTPFIKPVSGIAAEPEDYHFKDLDQNTSWKNFTVLLDDIRKRDMYLEAYFAARLGFQHSSNSLESPSFTDSIDDDDFVRKLYPESTPVDSIPQTKEKIYSDSLDKPLGPLMSLIAACSDSALYPDIST